MEAHTIPVSGTGTSSPSYQAFRALQIGFVAAPIIAGIDKFTNLLVDWEIYLAPAVGDVIDPGTFMAIVGVIEVIAGIGIALRPRIFGLVVAGWLVAIIVNLLMIPGFFDVALRDLGLAIGAFALSRLALDHDLGQNE